MNLPQLVGLKTHVGDLAVARDFWRRHFGLTPAEQGESLRYELNGVVWEQLPGGKFCGTRGPHGALPVFGIDDFSHARGYLLAHDIPIVFEEMLPGLNLIIFLDPSSNPFELAQETEPDAWDISQRKALITKRRQDAPQTEPISLPGVTELTIYAHDITASVNFYRDVVGLPVGLSYFAHVHLVAENMPVVLRTTRWRCKAPEQPHGTEPVFAVDNIDALADRLQRAGVAVAARASGLTARDPAGVPVHFLSLGSC
jgi:catechol 2,3-dioxygenase-like lactoylglutathione lyase family enzyme